MPERLETILSGLGSDIGTALKNCRFLSLWSQVVDEKVRKNTEPVKIRNRTLYISTTSPAWAQELSFLKGKIIEKFNEKAGEEVITDVRFRSAGVF